MKSTITLEEAIKVVKENYSNEGLTIQVLWSKEKEPMMKKVKLLNGTFGSKFKLITKHTDRGVMGIRNDVSRAYRRGRKLITFICVPDTNIPLCESEIPDDKVSYTYIIK